MLETDLQELGDLYDMELTWLMHPMPYSCRTLYLATELCQNCQSNPSVSTFHLSMRQHRAEVKYAQLLDVCTSCSQISAAQAVESGIEPELSESVSRHPCDSMDCPVYFERVKARNQVEVTMKHSNILDRLFEEEVKESRQGADGLLFAGQDLDF